jgi:hypothetical protein
MGPPEHRRTDASQPRPSVSPDLCRILGQIVTKWLTASSDRRTTRCSFLARARVGKAI